MARSSIPQPTPPVGICLLSKPPSRLYAPLAAQFKWLARIERSDTLPRVAPDLLIVDLADAPSALDGTMVQPLARRCEVWLVVGQKAIPPAWLSLVAQSAVRIVPCDREACADGFRPLTRAVMRWLDTPRGKDLTALVLEAEPKFEAVAPLVRALCEDPVGIRHPSDLATAVGLPLGVVKRQCRALQFTRVEHVITAVRALGYQAALGTLKLAPRLASRLVGIRDWPNHHRQLERARSGSPHAWRAAASAGMVAIAVLLSFLAAVACGNRSSEGGGAGTAVAATASSDSTIALPVTGALVRRGDLVLTVRTTGQVRAERLVVLKAETQGTVDSVGVRPGQRVAAGAVLVRLDLRPFELDVREAQGAVQDALARWRDVLIGDDTTDMRPEAVERRNAARLRSGLDAAEARLERAQLTRDRATVRAPFAGTADQVNVVVGQRVSAGETLTTLVDLGSLVVEADVLEHDLPLIRRGAEARVTAAAAADQVFAGSVIAVLPLVDTTSRAGRALIRVRTRDGVLRPGMYADVELEATRLPDRVMVPAPAVIERDGRPLVFRFSNGHAEWVYIAAGRSNGRETEVLPDSVTGRPAVVAGDTVLIEGHLTLTHDAPVRLVLREGSR
jgi:RND family efflux transporter MFP subunit